MKNVRLLKVIFIFIAVFLCFLFIDKVQANSISSINMDIYIDSTGTAHVKEVWNCNSNQGTEVYHPYYNLGNSKITNMSVKEGSTSYTTLSSWNTSGSLSSKAYKCGINKISNGVELCWGISTYGSHKYEVSYEITNFVSELDDCQMAYWTLIPYELSNTVGNVYIKIYSDFKYPQTLDVWGYGKYGAPCYVYNEYIEMTSDGTLYSSEYMTILIKFPSGSFNTTNKLNKNFDYYYNMAQEGSTKYNSSASSSSSSSASHLVGQVFSFIIIIFCFSLPFFGIIRRKQKFFIWFKFWQNWKKST